LFLGLSEIGANVYCVVRPNDKTICERSDIDYDLAKRDIIGAGVNHLIFPLTGAGSGLVFVAFKLFQLSDPDEHPMKTVAITDPTVLSHENTIEVKVN
jgi:hypothetical protein